MKSASSRLQLGVDAVQHFQATLFSRLISCGEFEIWQAWTLGESYSIADVVLSQVQNL